jgi:hypothetical protein
MTPFSPAFPQSKKFGATTHMVQAFSLTTNLRSPVGSSLKTENLEFNLRKFSVSNPQPLHGGSWVTVKSFSWVQRQRSSTQQDLWQGRF